MKKTFILSLFLSACLTLSSAQATCWNWTCSTYSSDCNGPEAAGADMCVTGSFSGTVTQDANPCTDGVTTCAGNVDGGTSGFGGPSSCEVCDGDYSPPPATGCAAYGMLSLPCPADYSPVTFYVSTKPDYFRKKSMETYYAKLMAMLGMPLADAAPTGEDGDVMDMLTCCVYDPPAGDCTCPAPCDATGMVAGFGATSCTNNTLAVPLTGACGTCPAAPPPSCVDSAVTCTAPTIEVGCY